MQLGHNARPQDLHTATASELRCVKHFMILMGEQCYSALADCPTGVGNIGLKIAVNLLSHKAENLGLKLWGVAVGPDQSLTGLG